MIAPIWRYRPKIHFRGAQELLDKQELGAIYAHELWHSLPEDRHWRVIAGFIGGCTVPTVVIVLLKIETQSTLVLFSLLIASAVAAALIQERMLARSEQLADAQAIKFVGEIPLMSAKLKLYKASHEKRGLTPEEEGQSQEQLLAKYLAGLGGRGAILRLLVPQGAVSLGARPSAGGQFEWLTVEGDFVLSLIDSRRTVEEVCKAAKAQRDWEEFVTCRLLHQFKKRGVIGT